MYFSEETLREYKREMLELYKRRRPMPEADVLHGQTQPETTLKPKDKEKGDKEAEATEKPREEPREEPKDKPKEEPWEELREKSWEEPKEEPTATGFLRVEVYTADRAYAVSNAKVTVRDSEGKTVRVVYSDPSGNTERLALPAPNVSPSENEQPQSYAVYDLTVEHDGYRTEKFTSVPVFAGIESVQPVSLIPDDGMEPMLIDEAAPEDSAYA